MNRLLQEEEASVVVGSLLGDAYLYPNGTLQIEHGIDQAAYVHWKYGVLKALVGKEPKGVRCADGRTGKVYCSVRFYTRAVLKEFRSLFYAEGRKVVPEEIAEMLDPLALAVWFMDDGGRGAHTPKGLVINTSCFSVEEQSILQEALAKRFGIETSVHKVGKYGNFTSRRDLSRAFARLSVRFSWLREAQTSG